jgi:hypothetical protein
MKYLKNSFWVSSKGNTHMTNIPVSGSNTEQKPATPVAPQPQPQVNPIAPADKPSDAKK